MKRPPLFLMCLFVLAVQTGVSAAGINPPISQIKTLNNIAALRLENPAGAGSAASGTRTIVDGYYTNGDGGGGEFFWDSASVATDDGGITINPTGNTTGRWIRNFDGSFVHVAWFGAKGDGTTDDTAAIQNAATGTYQVVKFAPKVYVVSGTITLDRGIALLGAKSGSGTNGTATKIYHTYAGHLFHFTGSYGSSANVSGGVRFMQLMKATGYSTGTAILCETNYAGSQAGRWKFEEVEISAESGTGLWRQGLVIDGSYFDTPGSRGFRTCSLEKVRISGCSANIGYAQFNQVTHFFVNEFEIDTGYGTGTPGFGFSGYCQNIFFTNMNINGSIACSSGNSLVGAMFMGRVSTVNIGCSSATGILISPTPVFTSYTNAASLTFHVITPGSQTLDIRGNLSIPNGSGYYGKDTAGNNSKLIGVSSGNIIGVGNTEKRLNFTASSTVGTGGFNWDNLPEYPDEATASAAGLGVGDMYMIYPGTVGGNATGALMIHHHL